MKSFTAILFLLLGMLSMPSQIHCQVKVFDKNSLVADLDTLYSTINEIHPNMFANIDKRKFEVELNKVKQQISKPMSVTEFYSIVAPLVVMLKDGHTSLYYTWDVFNNTSNLLFPLAIKATNDSTITITKSYSTSSSIPTGASLHSINKLSAKELIRECLSYANGELDLYRLSKVSGLFTRVLWMNHNDWTTFDVAYSYEGKNYTSTIKGIPYSERYKKIEPNKNVSPSNYSFSITNDSIGVIDFRSFIDLAKFITFADSTFRLIKEKKINQLIIDLRNNGGGNSSLGDELFQYISHKPFQQFGETIVKYSKGRYNYYIKRPDFFQGLSDSTFYSILGSKPFGTIDTVSGDQLEELRSNPLRYSGKVYLLISHRTFSSAASFAWAFKLFGMGKVIGEETGEPSVCYGDIIYQQLPNTGLQYSVSHKKFHHYGATDADIRGTMPDYEVPEQDAMSYTISKLIGKN